MRSERPERSYTTDVITSWVRRIAVTGSVVLSAVVLILYPSLPETVPTHFDLGGTPDAYGPRSSILLLVFLLGAMGVGMGWLSRKPQIFNYPFVVTPANAQAVYREGERMLVSVLVAVLLIYAGTTAAVFGLSGNVLVIIGLVVMFGGMVVGLVRVSRANRTPADDESPAGVV